MVALFQRLQNIDRRILYALLALVVAIPLAVRVPTGKPVVLSQTQGYFDAIESVARDPVAGKKLIIVSTNFSASTATENLTQCEATLRQIMSHRLRFALFVFNDPQGRDLGQRLAEKLAPEYGYEYGRDYVNWGYKAGDAALNLKALVRDIPGTIGADIKGTPIAQVPVMRGVKTVDDISLVTEIASANTLETWIAYFRAAGTGEPVPLLFACTAVMAPEAFPFLKSGQIQGLLNGLKGAGEYEVLIGKAGFGAKASAALSFSHFLILFLIVLGNVGMFVTRRAGALRGRR